MKVYIVMKVLCSWTCGCIIVSAKNKKEAAERIRKERETLLGDGVSWDNLEECLEEIGPDYYYESYGSD